MSTTTIVSPDLSLLSNEQQERIVYGKDDALFGYIEKQQHELLSLSSLNIDDNTTSSSNSTKTTLFGHVLDAGTGLHSLRWIASLCYMNLISSFTAITADHTMQQNCQKEINDLGISHYGTILCGHWLLPSSTTTSSSATNSSSTISISEQLHGQTFDVIIVDYLIGAMDGFIPYQQDLIISKLISFLKKSSRGKNNSSSNSHYDHSRMYIIGLEPIPDQITNQPSNGQQQCVDIHEINIMNLICKVRQVRDACILLAGQRCYREYPMEWIIRQIDTYRKSYNINSKHETDDNSSNNNNSQCIEKANIDFCPKVHKYNSKQFPILYRSTTIIKQINVGRSKLLLLPIVLRHSMEQLLNDLENQSKQYFDQYIKSQQQQQQQEEESTMSSSTICNSGKIQFGFDYVVTVECT